jgi:hypothetical protein
MQRAKARQRACWRASEPPSAKYSMRMCWSRATAAEPATSASTIIRKTENLFGPGKRGIGEVAHQHVGESDEGQRAMTITVSQSSMRT